MIINNNEFLLINIKRIWEKVLLVIDIKTDAETKNIYLNNYFEGLYIGNESTKYSVYTRIVDNFIEGEILYDTIKEYASKKVENTKRLWARCRIGNTYIDYNVIIAINEINITFSHIESYLFSQNNDVELSIKYSELKMQNPIKKFEDINDISDVRIAVDKNVVTIEASVKENLEGRVCLAWKVLSGNAIYYFHPEYIVNNYIKYSLPKNEMNKLGRLRMDNLSFEWIMVDEKGKTYKLYSGNDIKNTFLPVDDYQAQLYRDCDGIICMHMKTSIFFYYADIIYDGNGIRLVFEKRSYDLKLISVLVKRVNTDIEYELPIVKILEDERKIVYDIQLEFCEGVTEDNFRTGIYQFFVEWKDDFVRKKAPLKLFKDRNIKENTYIIFKQPYLIIKDHYYNCIFYNDTSNNLKCNIIPKRMKMQLFTATIAEKKIIMPYRIKKEAYFENVSEIRLISENGDMNSVSFDNLDNIYDNEIHGYMSIPIWIYEARKNCSLRLEICFNNRKESLFVENNIYRPAAKNRELCGFSFLSEIDKYVYRRIWGNHMNGSYMIGITEDAGLFDLDEIWIYEDKEIYIRIIWSDEENRYEGKDVSLYLKNVFTGEQIEFYCEWVGEDEIVFRIPLSKVENKVFRVIAIMRNGVISYIKNKTDIYTLFSNETLKKIILKKVDDSLWISVEKMLLWENSKRNEECQNIILKARNEKGEKRRKIWLIGENYGLSARDNGLAFFEYCMKHSDHINEEVYFVSKEENKDASVLEVYKEHVIIYDSQQHIYLDELAEFYVVSHGIRDVMPSLYHNVIDKYRKNVIYLQHGILAFKKIAMSNKSYGGSIRRFIVSSRMEKEFLVSAKQFWEDEIVISGMARYDKLSYNKKSGKYIWVMPTWRDWLIVKSEEEFICSDFYVYYSRMLSDAMLIETLRKSGNKLVFSLHIEFEEYKYLFDKYENDVVHITDMHAESLNERIMECDMIVTDYSSIAFDVLYLEKPALFFQYDQNMYNKYRGSYINFKTDLPGEVIYDLKELIDSLIVLINNGFLLDYKYQKCAERYFDFHDSNNSERIYKAIIECREEIFDVYENSLCGL